MDPRMCVLVDTQLHIAYSGVEAKHSVRDLADVEDLGLSLVHKKLN